MVIGTSWADFMTAEDPCFWWKSLATWLDPERHQNIRNGSWYCAEFKLKMHESCVTEPGFFCHFLGWFGGLFGFVVFVLVFFFELACIFLYNLWTSRKFACLSLVAPGSIFGGRTSSGIGN